MTITIKGRLSQTIAMVAGLTCYIAGCGYDTPHPSDSELQERFFRSRSKFDELALLLQQNPHVLAVGKGGSVILDRDGERTIRANRDWEYTEEPIRQIAKLLRELQITWGFQRCTNTPNQWMLFTNCNGLHPSSTCKGYILSRDSLRPQLPSLDGKPSSLDQYDRAYAPLAGNWRLLYEKWPGSGGRCRPRDRSRRSRA